MRFSSTVPGCLCGYLADCSPSAAGQQLEGRRLVGFGRFLWRLALFLYGEYGLGTDAGLERGVSAVYGPVAYGLSLGGIL